MTARCSLGLCRDIFNQGTSKTFSGYAGPSRHPMWHIYPNLKGLSLGVGVVIKCVAVGS